MTPRGRGQGLSEADLLAHYYRIVNEHPASRPPDPASVPPALAESLRRLAGAPAPASSSAVNGAQTPKKKRARRSEPAAAGPTTGATASLTDGQTPSRATKKRARQSAPPAVVPSASAPTAASTTAAPTAAPTAATTAATTTTQHPKATPGKRKRTATSGVLTSYGPCPFVFRFQPKERGTYLESDFSWVEGRWCDGVNRASRGGRGKGKALGDSSTIPPAGEEHEGLLADDDDFVSHGLADSRSFPAETPANVKVRGGRSTQGTGMEGGSKRKKRDISARKSAAKATGEGSTTDATMPKTASPTTSKTAITVTAMSEPDSSYETPTRQPVPLPPSSQPDHPPSSSHAHANGNIPSSQPTPTRPSKKGHTSKKDRLSQLRLDSSQPGPPSAADHPTTPVHVLPAVDEDEDELEHTPVVPKAKKKGKKERSKLKTQTKTASSRKRKAADRLSGAESTMTSEESREIVEQLLSGDEAAPGEMGEVDTPKTKKRREGRKHKRLSGDMFATPQADGHTASEGLSSEKRSKKHKADHTETASGDKDAGEPSKEKKRRRNLGWVVNTPEAAKS